MSSPRYGFIREIARGGMGQVDLVVRAEGTFRRLCAVKRLHPGLRGDPECQAMFLDEARIAGLIDHPNVVSVYDVGEDAEGPYLVMDYVDGVSVHRLISHACRDDAPLPVAIAVQIAAQAAEGLHAAHELRAVDGRPLELVHRDVSPQNILVGHDGVVRVTDFGIARALGRTTQTSTGVLKGKLGYMSPEQLRFRPLDRRSDLFALGVVLHEMLTGARLYPSRDGEGPRRILEEDPPDIGMERDGLPPLLVELCFRLLAKSPERRPSSAGEVAGQLREVLNDLMILDDTAIELEGYMAHRFAAQSAAHQAMVEDALERLERGALPAWPAEETLTAIEAPVPRPSLRPKILGAVLFATLLAGAVSVGVYIGRPSETPANESAASEEAAGEGAETDPSRPLRAAEVVEPPSPSPEPEVEPAPEPPEVTTTAARSPRRRRRARRPAIEERAPVHDPLAPADFGSIGGDPR